MSYWGVPGTTRCPGCIPGCLPPPATFWGMDPGSCPTEAASPGVCDVMPAWVWLWCGAGMRPLAQKWEVRNALSTRARFKIPFLNVGFLRNQQYSASISQNTSQKWFHRLNPHNLHYAWKWTKKRTICWAPSQGISGSLLFQSLSLHLTQVSIYFFISPFVTETLPKCRPVVCPVQAVVYSSDLHESSPLLLPLIEKVA